MQQHPLRKGHEISANITNPLSLNANKLILAILPVTAAVSRAVRELTLVTTAHATSIKKQIALRIDMLRRIFTYGNLALGGLWAMLALHEVPVRALHDTSRVIEPVLMTIEDHWPEGGLGDDVLDALSDSDEPPRVVKLAVREMPTSGKPEECLAAAGIDAQHIAVAASALVAQPVHQA